MTEQKFKAGDVVYLVSGGPLMTVSCIEGCMATTIWWEQTGDGQWAHKPTTDEFPVEALKGGDWVPPRKKGYFEDGS